MNVYVLYGKLIQCHLLREQSTARYLQVNFLWHLANTAQSMLPSSPNQQRANRIASYLIVRPIAADTHCLYSA